MGEDYGQSYALDYRYDTSVMGRKTGDLNCRECEICVKMRMISDTQSRVCVKMGKTCAIGAKDGQDVVVVGSDFSIICARISKKVWKSCEK